MRNQISLIPTTMLPEDIVLAKSYVRTANLIMKRANDPDITGISIPDLEWFKPRPFAGDIWLDENVPIGGLRFKTDEGMIFERRKYRRRPRFRAFPRRVIRDHWLLFLANDYQTLHLHYRVRGVWLCHIVINLKTCRVVRVTREGVTRYFSDV